jgi:hypothetical protein
MDSYFYNHRYYIERPKKRQKQYKYILEKGSENFIKVEIIPKPKPEYLERMRRLFPDFDQWDFEKQISMMGADDEE